MLCKYFYILVELMNYYLHIMLFIYFIHDIVNYYQIIF